MSASVIRRKRNPLKGGGLRRQVGKADFAC